MDAVGAGVTGGTGSGRSGVGSLLPVSFGASTLAVVSLAVVSLAVSFAVSLQSLGGLLERFGLTLAGRLDGIGLVALSFGGIDLVGFALGRFLRGILGNFLRTASSFAGIRPWQSSALAASSGFAASSALGSSAPGLPRLPSFCLEPGLPSVAASGACPGRASRFASRPGPCGVRPSASGVKPLAPVRGDQPAAKAIELVRLAFGLRLLPGVLGLLLLLILRLILGLIPCVGSPRSRPGRRPAPRPCRWRWYNAGAGSRAATTPARFSTGHGAFMAGGTGARENLRRAFAGLEVGHLRKRRSRREDSRSEASPSLN